MSKKGRSPGRPFSFARGLLVVVFFSAVLAWSGPGTSPQQPSAKPDQSKYGRHIISKDILNVVPEDYTGISLFAHEGALKTDVSMGYHCVTKPILFNMTHSHNNAEILCFIGGNPADIQDFGAEIKASLGPELEKHVITTTSCISIPANLPHCQLHIRKVTKPIVFLEISLTPAYKAIEGCKHQEGGRFCLKANDFICRDAFDSYFRLPELTYKQKGILDSSAHTCAPILQH